MNTSGFGSQLAGRLAAIPARQSVYQIVDPPRGAGSTSPVVGGMFGLGPIDWPQKAALVGSMISDFGDRLSGRPANSVQQTLSNLAQMNTRRALQNIPLGGDQETGASGAAAAAQTNVSPLVYAQQLARAGVPVDVALKMAQSYRALVPPRMLSPTEAKASGFRPNSVVQQLPGGEERVVQEPDVKSPEAVAQLIAINKALPRTAIAQERIDLERQRAGAH